ncbi:MAG TPA: hypothetical protein VML75_21145 [Kofleriaceae bacterium]|nr:hypothetical protein [Kofleriaceae bacterium]
MKISEATMVEVVTEASTKMSDPNYSAVMVGGFVQMQKVAAQFISAHEGELGGAEAVVNTIFHTSLIALAFQRANNRSVPTLSFEDLDHVSDSDPNARLTRVQPAVHAYITTNVEEESTRKLLMHMALAMDWAL